MAAIYDYATGYAITEGLQGCETCDEAIDMAIEIAAERGVPVVLEDDDGNWLVKPDGSPAVQIAGRRARIASHPTV